MLLNTITLKASTAAGLLYLCLEHDLSHLGEDDAPRISQHSGIGHTYVGYHLSGPEQTRNVQIYYLASSLTDFIVQHYEPSLLIKWIRSSYPTASREERLAILHETQAILQGTSRSKLAGEARLQSKAHIMYALLDYLNAEHLLILDGFVCFRLWEYRYYLHHIIRMAVESMRRERAHREFISLLRSFIELQEPRTEVAHVIVRPNGLYRILDRDYSLIDTEYLEGFAVNLTQHDLDLEDLLISALLTIAPFHIILHFPPEWSVTKAIQGIFGDRAEYCPGCRLCEKSRKAIAKIIAHRARNP